MRYLPMLGAALLSPANPATAQNWKEYGSHGTMRAYTDPDRMRRIGNTVIVWARFDNTPDAIPGESYRIFQEEINCLEQTSRARTITVFSRTGKPIAMDDNPAKFTPIIPGSMADTLMEISCR